MSSNIDIQSHGNGPSRAAGNGQGGKGEAPSGSPFYYGPPPVADREWRAWIVPTIVVANVVMFVATMYVNNCPAHRNSQGTCVVGFLRRFSFQPLRQNPLFGPSPATLEKLGALAWEKIVHQHQGWRLMTSMWLHAGVVHVLANMLSLVFIGIRLEQQFGFVRIGAIYLISGFCASILSALFIRNNISVGASGALFGLLGAMLSELITNWDMYTNKIAALLTLLVIVIINLAIGILPHVDNFAHIGGFLTGFIMGFVLLLQPQFYWLEHHSLPQSRLAKPKYRVYQLILAIIAFALLVAGSAVALTMLFRGENANDHCSWCHYLTCVPTSRWNCSN